MLPYPQIDPVIVHLGPFAPRWYGMAYLVGYIYGNWFLKKHYRWLGLPNKEAVDTIGGLLILGMLIFARAFYVIFYNWTETMNGPWYEPMAVWNGGLSFHGGLTGMLLASVYCVRKYKLEWLRLLDLLALVGPVGIFLGRIANFINGELWGRPTDVAWAMVFPGAGPLGRHPSQIYESLFEGLLLFVVLNYLWHRHRPRVGTISSLFILGYASLRTGIEFFREPDAQLGFIFGPLTMGQLLSILMFAGGILLLRYAQKHGSEFEPKPKRK